MADYLIGIDLGGTNVDVGVVDRSGKLIARHAAALGKPTTRQQVLDAIYLATEDTLRRAGMTKESIRGIGIATPGTLDIANGVVVSAANLPEWKDVPLRELVRKRFEVPTVLENDANAAAWGEFWVGAGRDVKSMILLTLGTGIGGGIVLDGKLWHGWKDSAGELGHITIDYRGRQCACGNIGCLEAYASADSTVRRFIEAVRSGKETNLKRSVEEKPDSLTSRLIYEEALKGDALSRDTLRETGFFLGVGIVTILHFMNPEMVVLTGGLTGAGPLVMDPLKKVVEERTFSRSREEIRIVFARLGTDAGVIGAAGCASIALETSAS